MNLYDGSETAVTLIYLAQAAARKDEVKSALHDLHVGLRRRSGYSSGKIRLGSNAHFLPALITRLATGPGESD
ncbi:hypothetical protein [Actinoplanes solisilvae]|uniref:hypothetical protein n=1 Tax=Actinoplanes solisilvae TaxID=2486853 RepID=UPI000FDBC7D0|nr:hypothetical protein [Actinoplanes solisilvae]